MKRWLPFLLTAWWMMFGCQANAQYVTIPDANFRTWLAAHGFAACFTGTQLDTTCSEVTSATSLNCNYGNVHDVSGIRYFDNLSDFHCAHNYLTTLPALPPSLTQVDCSYNQITSIAGFPQTLTQLFCDVNPLTSLPTLPPSLTWLDCAFCQLTTLPALPPSVTNIICYNNQLVSLPPLPPSLVAFNVNNNPALSCMPPLEAFTGTFGTFNIYGTGISCLPNVIQHTGFIPAMDTLPLCTIFGNGCDVAWNISGKVFEDNNSDCTLNESEHGFQNVKVMLSQGGFVQQQVYSNGGGFYSFATDFGTYDISIDTAGLPFTIGCPSDNSITTVISAADSLHLHNDFGLHCVPGFDLSISPILSASQFIPDGISVIHFNAGVAANHYGLACNTTGLSGSVHATLTGPVTVLAASGNGIVNGNQVVWDIADFSQSAGSEFSVTVLTDSIAIGAAELVSVAASVMPDSGIDNDPSNNAIFQGFTIVNSYDPNYKEVYPASVWMPGDWHTYTVHFQNTGTAPAQHIQVIDTLDSNLDWSSFQLLAYSHDNLTQVLQNGIVHFNFPNINLPDSTSDEPNSHGWIQYRIKTKSDIQPGTTIHNTASIYFDFNTPVVTNDALVTYCLPIETQQAFNLCPGDSVQVGSNVYKQSGTYTNLFTSFSGCDSTVTTIVAVIDTSISAGNASLFANGNAATYQWYDCNTNQPISGANGQTFTPLQNGSYAVQLSTGTCTAMSSCVNYTGVGIDNVHQCGVNVYPNPSQGTVQFDFNGHRGTLTIYNALGQTLRTGLVSGGVTLNDLPAGLLTYKFTDTTGSAVMGKLAVTR